MVIIGAGRIGGALKRAADDNDEACTLITRTEGWEVLQRDAGHPILVATRNDDLRDVLERVPPFRRDDLVFIQNGALAGWLAEHHLGRCTRGLLFFAVPDRQSEPTPGPDPSPFTGPHAMAVVRFLSRLGLPAQVTDWGRFQAWELEKLCWNSAFGLLCDLHDTDVGGVCDDHLDDLTALVDELRRVGRGAMNVDVPNDWLVDRLVTYSRSISDYRGTVKEWRWRNGWFVAEAVRMGLDTPVHVRMLRATGHEDKLPSTLTADP